MKNFFKTFMSQVQFSGYKVKLSETFQRLDKHSSSFSAQIESRVRFFNGLISRNRGRSLTGWLINNFSSVGNRLTRSRAALSYLFATHCFRIWKNESMKGLVLHLKVSSVLIQQAAAGYYISDTSSLGRRVRRSRTGFPNWIPRVPRMAIRQGDIVLIRLYLSFCSIYRILTFPSVVKVSTITDPGVNLKWLEDKKNSLVILLNQAITLLWGGFDIVSLRKKTLEFSYFSILRSAPITNFLSSEAKAKKEGAGKAVVSSALSSVILSAALWVGKSPSFKGTKLLDFLTAYTQGEGSFTTHLWAAAMKVKSVEDLLSRPPKPSFGRLGFKEEPAGKIRVFAMVDIWTQWLFYPLHKVLQTVLRSLSEDATFDQIGKVEAKMKTIKSKVAYSFDLSAATDRLPILLQTFILVPLLGMTRAACWGAVLVGRLYDVPPRPADKSAGLPPHVRYTVGQPMGALSSWVMLAITHHVIVQWAYRIWISRSNRAPHGWFKDYIVLGDDIVIFHEKVALIYFDLMVKTLGVNINLSKSVVSRKGLTLEFAKKYWHQGSRAFAYSPRDFLVASLSSSVMIEFMTKHSLKLSDYFRIRGLGYKAKAKWMSTLWNAPVRVRIYMVFKRFYELDWTDWIRMRTPFQFYEWTPEICFLVSQELLNRTYKSLSAWIKADDAQDQEIIFVDENLPFLSDSINAGKVYPTVPRPQHDVDRGWYIYGELVKESDLKSFDRFKSWGLPQWFELIKILLSDYCKLKEVLSLQSTTGWLTQYRQEERAFKDLLIVYKEWCLFNSFFQKKRAIKTDVRQEKPESPSNRPSPEKVAMSIRDSIHLNPLCNGSCARVPAPVKLPSKKRGKLLTRESYLVGLLDFIVNASNFCVGVLLVSVFFSTESTPDFAGAMTDSEPRVERIEPVTREQINPLWLIVWFLGIGMFLVILSFLSSPGPSGPEPLILSITTDLHSPIVDDLLRTPRLFSSPVVGLGIEPIDIGFISTLPTVFEETGVQGLGPQSAQGWYDPCDFSRLWGEHWLV